MVAAAQKSGEELAAERDAAARGAEPGAGGPRIGTGGGCSARASQQANQNCPKSKQHLLALWSTWSAVGNLTSRAGGLRSTPSGPDDRDRVTG